MTGKHRLTKVMLRHFTDEQLHGLINLVMLEAGRRMLANSEAIEASGSREKIVPRQPGDTTPAKHPHPAEIEDEASNQPERDRQQDEADLRRGTQHRRTP
jgi:hypothetical protein